MHGDGDANLNEFRVGENQHSMHSRRRHHVMMLHGQSKLFKLVGFLFDTLFNLCDVGCSLKAGQGNSLQSTSNGVAMIRKWPADNRWQLDGKCD